MSFRNYRILILLLILLLVAWDAWMDRREITAWDHPLRVVVYPINADGSTMSARYIAGLRESHFDRLEKRIGQEAKTYGLSLARPLEIALSEPLAERPPAPPIGGNIAQIMWWNFKVRRWAGKMDNYSGPSADIRAFVQFHDHQANGWLSHSVGVEKGHVAIVNLYSTRAMAAQNDMVLLHEILHTLGATDKYDPATNQPLFPQGYAKPDQQPLHPQNQAEVMAGRVALSKDRFREPQSMSEVIIGPLTAEEIGWR